jgi:DGQHR domain-containing protein
MHSLIHANLPGLLSDRNELDAMAKKRMYPYHEVRLHPRYESVKRDEGYQVARHLKSVTVFQKPKENFQVLEDSTWYLLYMLGYEYLNADSQFYLPPRGGDEDSRQVDTFGLDDETAVVIECKTKERLGNKNLSVAINDLANRRSELEGAVAKATAQPNIKLITILATSGINWRREDKASALAKGVFPMTERELRYYSEHARNVGRAGRYQFHAEFLQGRDVGSTGSFKYLAQRVSLAGKDAVMFSAPARDLIKLSFVNHRDLRDPESSPSYQRLLLKKRLNQVTAFVDNGGGFYNSILVSLKKGTETDLSFDEVESVGDARLGLVTLPGRYKSLRIIDGQHRLYGAAQAKDPIDVVVIALTDVSDAEEARLFKEINKEQKGVDASLLGELEGELEWNSDDPKKKLLAVASRLADRMLNDKMAVFGDSSLMSVADLRSSIISSHLIGVIKRGGGIGDGILSGSTCEQTLENAEDFFNAHFKEMRDANIGLWGAVGTKKVHGLPGTNVFAGAHLSLLRDFAKVAQSDRAANADDLKESFAAYMKAYCDILRDSNLETYQERFTPKYGNGGAEDLKLRIAVAIRERHPDFNISGLSEHMRLSDRDRVGKLREKAVNIASAMLDAVKQRLAQQNPDFWSADRGALPPKLSAELIQRRKASNMRYGASLEAYLRFQDVKAHLVKPAATWDVLKGHLNIKGDDTKSKGRKHVEWMDIIAKVSGVEDLAVVSDEEEMVISNVTDFMTAKKASLEVSNPSE